MSRTWNTQPYRVAEAHYRARKQGWRFYGYPALLGGAWEGRRELAKHYNRLFRWQWRRDLLRGREPVQKVVKRVAWELW